MINHEYIRRINKVIDYIERFPGEDHSLEKLADIASFSKYHFHRIFKAIQNENLNDYIKRIRLEKSYKMLQKNKNLSILEISELLGFSTLSNFSKAFKQYFSISPSEARKSNSSKIERKLMDSPNLKLSFKGIQYRGPFRILYTRVNAGYSPMFIQSAFKSLFDHLLNQNIRLKKLVTIGIGYDDPDYTESENCRYDACIVLDNVPEFTVYPYQTKTIDKAQYAVFDFEGYPEQFYTAWDEMFKRWLVQSEYEPDMKPHLEIYQLPQERFEENIYKAELCLPVKKIHN